jgi:hypothetical protein
MFGQVMLAEEGMQDLLFFGRRMTFPVTVEQLFYVLVIHLFN